MNRGYTFYGIKHIMIHAVTCKTHLDILRITQYITSYIELLRNFSPHFQHSNDENDAKIVSYTPGSFP